MRDMKIEIAFNGVLLWLVLASTASAHIKMLKPTPWIVEDDLGGPQKGAPCGPGGFDGAFGNPPPTNAITEFEAGETITVEWQETVAHPGHFRIALAEDRAELEDPDFEVTGDCAYEVEDVPKEPHGNVLADYLFPRTEATEMMFSTKVTLPTEPCEKCTLQLIQFMTEHSQPCIYYHCADIKIVSAASTAGAGGKGGAGGGAGSAGGGGSSGNGTMTTAGTTAAMAGAGAGGAPTTPSSSEQSGCSLADTAGGRSARAVIAMAWLAAAVLWLRRRRSA